MFEKLRQFFSEEERTGTYLLAASFLFSVFLIVFANTGILPIERPGDFIFLAAVFLAFALFRPSWAFVIFLAVCCIENIRILPESMGLALRPYQLSGIMALSGSIALILMKKTSLKLPAFGMGGWLALGMAAGGFLSAAAAENQAISFKQAVVVASFVALMWLVRIFVKEWRDIVKVAPFFMAGGIAALGYAIWQSWRFSRGLEAFMAMPGRPNGTFSEPDWLGIFSVFFLAAICVGLEYGWIHGRRLAASIFGLLMWADLTVLILTVARSAWLGAAAVLLAYLGLILTGLRLDIRSWAWKRSALVAALILSALVLSYATVNVLDLTNFQLFSRAKSAGTGLQKITVACEVRRCSEAERCKLPDSIGSMEELATLGCRHIDLEDIEKERQAGFSIAEIYRPDPNVGIRGRVLRESWELIRRSPVLGIGWGSAAKFLGKDERGVDLNSSNIFLEIWLGSGMLGMASWMAMVGLALWRGYRAFIRSGSDHYFLGLLLLLGTVAIIIPNLFNAGLLLAYVWVFLALV